MATFQLFFQSGRAKDLSAPLYMRVGSHPLTTLQGCGLMGVVAFHLPS